MDKRLLEVLGITYNQIESGVYAVILKEAGGDRRIPIVIGYPEAQAIECNLQEIVTPRPLTHDMMLDMMDKFGIRIDEVYIYRLPSGVFAADIFMSKGRSRHVVDSRSSDAIALALRAHAPIYTTSDVLDEVGFAPEESKIPANKAEFGMKSKEMPKRTSDPSKTIEKLTKEMEKAAADEKYEEAAKLKAKIEDLKKGLDEHP